MISEKVLEKLLAFTDEEIDALNGKSSIDTSIFSNQLSKTIDYHKLLDTNQQISVRKHTRFIDYPEHNHNYIELMYVYSGSLTHIVDGKEIVLQQGEFSLLDQHISHSIKFASEDDIIFNFIIRPDFFDYLTSLTYGEDNILFSFILDSIYSQHSHGKCLVFKQNKSQVQKVSIVEQIITEMYEPSVVSQAAIKLYVGSLLVELVKDPKSIDSYVKADYENVLVSQVLTYIYQNYQEGKLQTIAAKLNLPEYHISKLIKKSLGITFKEVVQDVRLSKSCELLRNTKLSIIDIMSEIGYQNISFFYKIFKEKYQMTPNEYRGSKI